MKRACLVALIVSSVAMAQSNEPSYPWAASPTPNYSGIANSPPCDSTRNGALFFDTVSNTVLTCNGAYRTWVADYTAATAPLAMYVTSAADGGSDSNQCTIDKPCASIQRALDLVPTAICDSVSVNAWGDYAGGKCGMKTGLQRCGHPAGDGGVVLGTFTLSGQLVNYAPTDAGTGSGTISAVTAGSVTTGQNDEWKVSSGGFNTNELAGLWVGVTGGTGSGTDHIWPIIKNDAGVMTLDAHGEIATLPVAGSTYQLYQNPAPVLSSSYLGQRPSADGPEDNVSAPTGICWLDGQATISANRGSDRWMTVQHLTMASTNVGSLVRASGEINIRENASLSTTGSLLRSAPGPLKATLERNIVAGSAGNLLVPYNFNLGVQNSFLQIYNNYAPVSNSGFFIAVENASAAWLQSNYAPNALVRVTTCDNCTSKLDTFGAFRVTGGIGNDQNGGNGSWSIDGTTFTGGTYTLSLSHARVIIDANGGPFSTITALSGGNSVALQGGSRLQWAAGTTFNNPAGGGFVGIQVTDGISTGPTIAAIRAANTRTYFDNFGNFAQENSGSPLLMYPVLSPYTGITPPQICYDSVTLAGGTVSPLFSSKCTNFSATPSCTCTDTSGGIAGTAVGCSVTAISTTGLTIDGTGTDTVSYLCIGGR